MPSCRWSDSSAPRFAAGYFLRQRARFVSAVGGVPLARRSIAADVAPSRDSHAHALRSVQLARAEWRFVAARLHLFVWGSPMKAASVPDRDRENAYLRLRNAQLEADIQALSAEVERLRQTVERLHGRTAARPPNPLSGGQ